MSFHGKEQAENGQSVRKDFGPGTILKGHFIRPSDFRRLEETRLRGTLTILDDGYHAVFEHDHVPHEDTLQGPEFRDSWFVYEGEPIITKNHLNIKAKLHTDGILVWVAETPEEELALAQYEEKKANPATQPSFDTVGRLLSDLSQRAF